MSVVVEERRVKTAKGLVASMSLLVMSQVVMLMNGEPVKAAKWIHLGLIAACLIIANIGVFMITTTEKSDAKATNHE